jgi:hypothetical protein
MSLKDVLIAEEQENNRTTEDSEDNLKNIINPIGLNL